MDTFFDNFYLHGWAFFYRFTLTLLRILQPKVLELDDLSEIIDMVKTPMQQKNFHRDDPGGDRGAENFSQGAGESSLAAPPRAMSDGLVITQQQSQGPATG